MPAKEDNNPDFVHPGYINDRYSTLLVDYLKCTSFYLNDFAYPQLLEKQLDRLDLDTVCAYELYQMKKAFTKENVLDLSNWQLKEQ